MRIYRIDVGRITRFAGTQALATALRNELLEATGIRKKDSVLDQVEFPMAKSEFLATLNALLVEKEGAQPALTSDDKE